VPEQPNISPTEQQIVLRLDALLDELVSAGFARDRVGTPMRLRLLALLNQLPVETLPEQLKFKISALVCQSEAEQAKFYGIFDTFLSRFLPDADQEPISPVEKKAETPETKTPETPNPESPKPATKEPLKGSHRTDPVKAARSGPITVELHFRDDGYRPWNLPELEAVVRPMREKELTGAEEWDIPNTIKKTIEAGGAPHFARRRRKKAPQYLFLIEQKSVRDHLAGFYADLATELQRRDLDVEYYFYDRFPQKCWKERRDPASYTTIDRLNASFSGSRLILIGEPDGLLAVTREPSNKPDQVNTKIHRYPSVLAFELREQWSAVAMLNTRSTANWGDAELAIHQLFPVAPANVVGLGSLMGQWKNRISYKPYYWKTECPEPMPPSFQDFDGTAETIEKHIKNLKVYLGRQGYTWLCAIAVYPEIYWQLTKILHDEAISAVDVPDESLRTQLWHLHLLRLSRLAWLRQGYIPSEYRQDLRKGLPAANAAEVRRQLLEVLQLGENRPPEGSYAEKDRAYTVALFDHERYALLENPDKERLSAMQEKLRQDVLDAGVAISDIEDAVGRSLFRNLPDVPIETIKQFWVLWVDDSPGNNKDFQEKTSKEFPIRFVNATSTTLALETLQKQTFDIIISDVSRFGDKEAGMKMMPRFKEAGISVPVYFFTHPKYVEQHQETLRGLGAVAVVTDFGELAPLLVEAMEGKEKENKEALGEIEFMEKARQVSRAVCRVVLENGGLGSGFLVEGNYLFTAAHVLQSPENLPNTSVEFNIELDETGNLKQAVRYQLYTKDFIFSPVEELDFFRVKIIDREDAPLSQWGYIELETSQIPDFDDAVFMPHHAQGKERQIEKGKVIGTEGIHLDFVDDALKLPGAGGAPVLNQQLKAIGIYRLYKENLRLLGETAREAILIRDIWSFIQSQETQGAEPNYNEPNFAQTNSNIGPEPNQSSAYDPKADLLLQARTLLDNGTEARKKEAFEAAQSMLQNALELYTQAGDDAGQANSQHELGKFYLQLRQLEQAKASLESALPVYQRLDFNAAQAFVLMDLGKVEMQMSNYDKAEQNYNEALESLEELSGDASEDMIEVYQALGTIAQAKKDLEKAKKQFLTALKLSRTAGLKTLEYQMLHQLGKVNLELRDANQALGCFENALNLATTSADRAQTYELLAAANEIDGQPEKALDALNEAYALYYKEEDTAAHVRVGKKIQELTDKEPGKKNIPNNPQSQQYVPESPVFETSSSPDSMKLFILCSQEDERTSQTLNKHLAVLKNSKSISVFNSVSDIVAGEDWSRRIKDELDAADFILPIISVNLLASDYTYGLLRDAMTSGKRIVPILAKRVDIEGTGLEQLRSIPSQGRWISDFKDEDEAYSDIVREIKRLSPTEKGHKAPEAIEDAPVEPKTNVSAQQVRDLISKARLGDALKLIQKAMPDNIEVVLQQGRLAELERGERLGILDRQSANITRNQITSAVLEMIRDLPDRPMA